MRRRLAGAAVGVAAALALAACSGTSAGGSAAAGSPPSAAASSAAGSGAGQGTAVQVQATEFAFSLPTTDFSAGTYTFTMHDDGHATHAMEIEGPGLSGAKSSTAGPGGTATLTVTLRPGTYTLYCPVGNHRQAGMQTTLTVR